jgi:hypothetical protein
MQENIVAYLREHPDGVSSQVLAELFLKFKNPEPVMAHRAVAAILKNDIRCRMNKQNVWFAEIKKDSGSSLRNEPFTAVYCLTDPSRKLRKLFYISIWDICENQSNLFNAWLSESIPPLQEFESSLESEIDINSENSSTIEQSMEKLYQLLQNRIPVFLSSFDYSIVKQTLSLHGYYLTDDVVLLSELFHAAGIPAPKPLSFESVCQTLHHQIIPCNDIRNGPEQFAVMLGELVESLLEKGIETRDKLDDLINKNIIDWFRDKDFNINTIQALPTSAGVYGFKDRHDSFIYIGKAKNLKRRLFSYFRTTSESPEKISKLRSDSHKLVTYQCASELEAIIYEYRLIRKHKPALNSQLDVNERTGTYKPVSDCIIVLSHTLNTKLMLFMLRQNQKVVMKPVEFPTPDKAALQRDIDEYFFKGVLPAEPTDFPEMELATRWIKNNREGLNFIEVYNYSDAQETADILVDLIKSISRETVFLKDRSGEGKDLQQ